MTRLDSPRAVVSTIFGRLFENEFATLDGIAISCRTSEGMAYLEGTDALAAWLGWPAPEAAAAPDPDQHAIHAALHAATPAHDTVISGWSRSLCALLQEGFGPPPSTSMMRNRGIPDLGAHLVEPAALHGPALVATIGQARELAERAGMRHLLIISREGMVVVSGAPPYEAMAHWHNVEFAARVECLRLADAGPGEGGNRP